METIYKLTRHEKYYDLKNEEYLGHFRTLHKLGEEVMKDVEKIRKNNPTITEDIHPLIIVDKSCYRLKGTVYSYFIQGDTLYG